MSPNLPCEGIRKPEGPAFLTRLYPEMGGQVRGMGQPGSIDRYISKEGSTRFNRWIDQKKIKKNVNLDRHEYALRNISAYFVPRHNNVFF